MEEVEVKFGRKVKTGDYENATFEITAKVNMGDTNNALAKTPELFEMLKKEVEKEILKFKEEKDALPKLQKQSIAPVSRDEDKQLGTTKTEVDLPEKFSIVDPKNPNKTLYSVENGIALDQAGTYKGTLEPRAGRTGAYYLLRNMGILTKNGNNWYLKDKRNDKWVTIGVLKNG